MESPIPIITTTITNSSDTNEIFHSWTEMILTLFFDNHPIDVQKLVSIFMND